MLCIQENKLSTYSEPQLQELYEYNCVLITTNGCNYVILLNTDFTIYKSFLHIGNITLVASKFQKYVFVNSPKYYNCYIHYSNPVSFTTIDQYKQYMDKKVATVRVMDISNFSMVTKLELTSHSELINLQKIHNWVSANKNAFKLCTNDMYVKHYNFYNYVLYSLSRRGVNISDTACKQVFKVESSSQHLSIDLQDNRASTASGINYLNLRKQDEKLKLIKPKRGMWLFQIDFVSSYLQLLHSMLDIQFPEEDIYFSLAKQLGLPSDMERPAIKERVFKILFSSQLKNYMQIGFFNDMYQFSVFLYEQYKAHGFVNSLISGKKLYLPNGEKNLRSKLFNMFIMNLQFEVYIGVLYQLLQYKREKINPVIFIHDSIIMEIDSDKYLADMENIENVITFGGRFRIARKLGKNLYQMHNI